MATLAFSSALSHAGVKYLAASPETMLAPGVPSGIAHDIAAHTGDAHGMAKAVVDSTMNESYDAGPAGTFGPAAAFDVIDLDAGKTAAVAAAVRTLDTSLIAAAKDPGQRAALREDAKGIDGMVRFPEGKALPWRADRPAIALYQTFAQDGRLGQDVRAAALHAANAVADTVLAHRESNDFAPFNDADYSDADGPTVHFPLTHKQIDTWGPQISETDNAFYKSVGAAGVAKVIA